MTQTPPPLILSLTVPPDRLVQASNIILSREMGPWRRLSVFVLPGIGSTAMSALAGWGLGLAVFDAILVGLYGYFGAIAGFLLVRRLLGSRNTSILTTSALRSLPMGVTLDETGLGFAARTVPWNGVSGTGRWKDLTLVYFSPVDALVIPDAALPPGTTYETLAAQITAWKVK